MNREYTEIAVVLDKSGSMFSKRSDVIGGFNKFLEEQQKAPGNANLTLVTFDTTYNIVHNGRNIQDIAPMTENDYVPGGMTALLDATARTITEIGNRLSAMPEADRPGQVVIAVFTDGEENSSKEHTLEQLRSMIDNQEKNYKWLFLYLGEGLEAFDQGSNMGYAQAASVNTMGKSYGSTMVQTSAAITNLRAGMDADETRSLWKSSIEDDQK